MSADGSVTLVWGDGENQFRFAIGQFRELQERVNQRRLAIGGQPIGPMSLLLSLQAKDAWPDDVRDILRIGLVGAGMPIKEVHQKLVTYFDNTPFLEHILTAHAVLFSGFVGIPRATDANEIDDGSKKKTTSTSTSPSISENSTEPALH